MQKRTMSVHPDAVEEIRKLWSEQREIGPNRWAYRKAAAVLDTFEPADIQPFEGDLKPNGYPQIDEDAVLVSEERVNKWRLLDDVRREALLQLGERERMQLALQANPEKTGSALQIMFNSLIYNELQTIESLSREQLRSLLIVLRWVDCVLPLDSLPNKDAVAAAFARADLLAPFKHLLADGFVNRKSQLRKLNNFLWQTDNSPPMMLYGIGGVGKSTLLSKHTLDESEKHADYLLLIPIDVDRPSVRPHKPHTFFVEAVTQIVRQLPNHASKGELLNRSLREHGSRYSTSDEGYEFESSRSSEKEFPQLEDRMVSEFCDFLTQVQQPGDLPSSALPSKEHRVLIMIDTFEEVQVLGNEVAAKIVRLFATVADRHAGVRIIFSGRIRADEPAWMEEQILPDSPKILLKNLDKRSAVSLLKHLLKRSELQLPKQVIEEAVKMVGRNPMCIKLAAQVIRIEGADAFLNEETRQQLLLKLRDAKIQAFLFGRILDHLQTQRIRAVAYPGLIVRRVTPDVIVRVLAEPCGLDITGPADAEQIYHDLSREKTMVEPDGTGGLRYRPDLRRELLPDVINKVDPAIVTKIDQNAVEFYSQFTTREARAEEIYHRLRLGSQLDDIDERWMSGLREHLRSSVPELPEAGRIWLARKLNMSVDSSTRKQASQTDWEQMAALKAARYLKSAAADEALAAIRERTERTPNSPLFSLETEALRLRGDMIEARQVATRGLDMASGDYRTELLLQLASILESEHDLNDARQWVDKAVQQAEDGDNVMLKFRALITMVRLLRKTGHIEDRDQLRHEVVERLTGDVLKELRRYPKLFEETAAELGTEMPEVLAEAAKTLGVHVRSDRQHRALADVFHENLKQGSATKIRIPKNLDKDHARKIGESIEAAEEFVRGSKGAGLGRFAADMVKAAPADSFSNSRLADYFRDSVEQGLEINRVPGKN